MSATRILLQTPGRPIGTVARLAHWLLIGFTFGLWWPVYYAARKAHGEIT